MQNELINNNNIKQENDGEILNNLSSINFLYNNKLNNNQFRMLSEFIYKELGIKMPEVKKTMLESRLHKRLKETNNKNFSDYLKYLFSAEGKDKELVHMFDVITTNKTDFFREPSHFEHINSTIIQEFILKKKN